MEQELESIGRIPPPPMWWMETRAMSAEQLKELQKMVGEKVFAFIIAAQFTYMKECAAALQKYYGTIEGIFPSHQA